MPVQTQMLSKVEDIALLLALQQRMGGKQLSRWFCGEGPAAADERLHAAAGELRLHPRPADHRMAEKLVSISAYVLMRCSKPYPERLGVLAENAPLFLYCRGEVGLLQETTIAVIGTRRPSLLGRSLARQYVREICSDGISIISGNAPGIDSAAHEEALLAGGRTLFFPAVPLERWSAEFHMPVNCGGRYFVGSPFLPGSETHPYCFLRRNSLVAALCHAALVVETGTRGGTLDTVAKLKELNRPTFAIQYSPGARRYEAHRLLLGRGVTALPHQVSRGAAEVLTEAARTNLRTGTPDSHLTTDFFTEPGRSSSE